MPLTPSLAEEAVYRLPPDLREEFLRARERVYEANQSRKMLRHGLLQDYLLRMIPYSDDERKLAQDVVHSTGKALSFQHYLSAYTLARNLSQIVRFSPDFTQLIGASLAPAFDHIEYLHAVYPVIVAEFEGGIYLKQFDMTIQCMLAWACDPSEIENMEVLHLDLTLAPACYYFGVLAIGYDEQTGLCDCYAMPWAFDEHGKHVRSSVEWNELFGVARATFDLLSSPSVRLEAASLTKLNKARKKKGRAPLEPYEMVRWSRETRSASESTGAGTKHGHRYDVRGNWATFTKGSLEGRRVWRKPHQRGLVNPVHRAHIYEVKE